MAMDYFKSILNSRTAPNPQTVTILTELLGFGFIYPDCFSKYNDTNSMCWIFELIKNKKLGEIANPLYSVVLSGLYDCRSWEKLAYLFKQVI